MPESGDSLPEQGEGIMTPEQLGIYWKRRKQGVAAEDCLYYAKKDMETGRSLMSPGSLRQKAILRKLYDGRPPSPDLLAKYGLDGPFRNGPLP